MKRNQKSALDEIKNGNNVSIRRRLERKDPELMGLGFEATKMAAMYPGANPLIPLLLESGFPVAETPDSQFPANDEGRNALHYLMLASAIDRDFTADPRADFVKGRSAKDLNSKWLKALTSILKHMTAQSIPVNKTDAFGMTPAMVGIDSGNIDQAFHLIQEHGASVDGLYADGRTMFGLAFEAMRLQKYDQAFDDHNHAILKHPIFQLFKDKGLTPNQFDFDHKDCKELIIHYSAQTASNAAKRIDGQEMPAVVIVKDDTNVSDMAEVAPVVAVKKPGSLFDRYKKPGTLPAVDTAGQTRLRL